jgi:hypothetical protein
MKVVQHAMKNRSENERSGDYDSQQNIYVRYQTLLICINAGFQSEIVCLWLYEKIFFDREDGECSHHEKTFAIDSNSDFGCSDTAIECQCAGTEAASAGKSSARRAWANGTSGPSGARRAGSASRPNSAGRTTTPGSAKSCRSATRPAKSRSANAPGRAAHAATSGSAKGSRAATHPATSNSSNASGHTTHR